MVIALYVALALFVLMVTFHVGRLAGRRQGHELARAEIPLQLRSVYLLEQRCPICDDEHRYPFPTSQTQR